MFSTIRQLLAEMLIAMKQCNVLLRVMVWSWTVRPLGFGLLKQVSEGIHMGTKVYGYELPLLPVKPDTAAQRLVIAVDGVESTIVLNADSDLFEFGGCPLGSTVDITLDYLDEAGNDSGNVTMSFVVEDKTAPETPDGFGELRQVSETEIPDEPVDPPVDVPVDPPVDVPVDVPVDPPVDVPVVE